MCCFSLYSAGDMTSAPSDLRLPEAAATANEEWQERRHYPGGDDDSSTIFVSVASYRDPETPKTLQHLFKQAKNPNRITVLVHEQNEQLSATTLSQGKPLREDPCAITFPGSGRFRRNIRLLKTPSYEAQGPIIARAKIEQELYTPGEADFWLQIDSHMRFIRHWDKHLLEQHAMLPDPRHGILTTYPADYDISASSSQNSLPNLSLPTYIGFHDFNQTRLLPTQQRFQYAAFPSRPRESLFYAACFAFGPAEMVSDVPYDPRLRYLFLGEEISMAARLFTSGYTLYNPLTMPLYHATNRNYRPTYWEQLHRKNAKASEAVRKERKQMEEIAMGRLYDVLGLSGGRYGGSGFATEAPPSLVASPSPSDDEYGLGKSRRLDEFESYIGLDLKKQLASPRAKLGIMPCASDEEWVEKYRCTKTNWSNALRRQQLALLSGGPATSYSSSLIFK